MQRACEKCGLVIERDTEQELDESFKKHDLASRHIRWKRGMKLVFEGVCPRGGHVWHCDTALERDEEHVKHLVKCYGNTKKKAREIVGL